MSLPCRWTISGREGEHRDGRVVALGRKGFQYRDRKIGRIVADVVRIGKGYTEGLEPAITERLVQLMLSREAAILIESTEGRY